MKLLTDIRVSTFVGLTYLVAGHALAYGQDSQAERPQQEQKRFTVGLRGRELPFRRFGTVDNRSTMFTATTPSPARDYQFTTTSHSPHWGLGLALEYALPNDRWTISAEAMVSRLRYTKVTTLAWGSDDPATVNDERSHMFYNEDNRATLIDLPVLVHHRGLARSGAFSKVYVAAGAALRSAINIHSSTTITNADTTTSTNNYLVAPARRNVVGGVVGIGIRIVDDFKITWTPEIRYTHWAGSTFSADSTLSPRNQIEVGMGFTF